MQRGTCQSKVILSSFLSSNFTFDISGSEEMRLQNLAMAVGPSSMPWEPDDAQCSCTGINPHLVHVDVKDLSPILHLDLGDGQRLVILPILDKAAELPATGHIASLADVHKVVQFPNLVV